MILKAFDRNASVFFLFVFLTFDEIKSISTFIVVHLSSFITTLGHHCRQVCFNQQPKENGFAVREDHHTPQNQGYYRSDKLVCLLQHFRRLQRTTWIFKWVLAKGLYYTQSRAWCCTQVENPKRSFWFSHAKKRSIKNPTKNQTQTNQPQKHPTS